MRLYPPVSYMSRKLDSDLHLGNIMTKQTRIKLRSYWTSNKGTDLFTSNRNNKNVGPKNARVEQPVLESLSETISLPSKDCFLVTCYNCDKLDTVSKWKCSFKSLWNLCSKNKLINTLWPSMSQYWLNLYQTLATNGKITRWSSEDISQAVMMRAFLRRSFDFCKNFIYTVSLPSTLRRWCAKFTCHLV